MDAAGIAKLFEPSGGDIDAVARKFVVFCYHVAQIDADAEDNPVLGCKPLPISTSVVGRQFGCTPERFIACL